MEIRRFFTTNRVGDTFILDGEEFEHAVKVLRYKKGYILIVCDGTGYEYTCVIEDITKSEVVAKIQSVDKSTSESEVSITLYQCLPKGDKLDLIVQKAIELGVTKIVPLTSQNVSETKFNYTRLLRVVREASKQCGRAILPTLTQLVDIEDVVFAEDIVLFANERETLNSLSSVKLPTAKSIAVVVGSEGGFTLEECQSIIDRGALSVSLGRRILRSETAGIVMTALATYLSGGLDI